MMCGLSWNPVSGQFASYARNFCLNFKNEIFFRRPIWKNTEKWTFAQRQYAVIARGFHLSCTLPFTLYLLLATSFVLGVEVCKISNFFPFDFQFSDLKLIFVIKFFQWKITKGFQKDNLFFEKLFKIHVRTFDLDFSSTVLTFKALIAWTRSFVNTSRKHRALLLSKKIVFFPAFTWKSKKVVAVLHNFLFDKQVLLLFNPIHSDRHFWSDAPHFFPIRTHKCEFWQAFG